MKEEEITKIIYQNSTNDSECIRIPFEKMQGIVKQIAMMEPVKYVDEWKGIDRIGEAINSLDNVEVLFEDGTIIDYMDENWPFSFSVEWRLKNAATVKPVEVDPFGNLIIGLVRCVLASNPNEAILHQINRLHKYYDENCNDKIADAITNMLSHPDSSESGNFKIVQSAPVKPVDITVLINKINERIRLIPDEPNLSQRGALDAYLNVISWANDKAIENPTVRPLIQSGVPTEDIKTNLLIGLIEKARTYMGGWVFTQKELISDYKESVVNSNPKQVKQPVSSNDIHATSLDALDKFLNKISKEELKSMLDKHQVIDGSGITFGEYLANIGGAVKQPVMQWVKASERLPAETGARISWRFTNSCGAGLAFNIKEGFVNHGLYTKAYKNIEWLEEPPIQ